MRCHVGEETGHVPPVWLNHLNVYRLLDAVELDGRSDEEAAVLSTRAVELDTSDVW